MGLVASANKISAESPNGSIFPKCIGYCTSEAFNTFTGPWFDFSIESDLGDNF